MKKFIAILLLFPILAFAWQPTKPITVIFPNGPGAGNEISFRIVSQPIEKRLGISFKPEHRPGADGNIAISYFNTVPADGYTIAVPACQSNWVTAEIWYPQAVKYNIMEFIPVANIARSPLTFWAHPQSKINTPEELAEAIRRSDRPLTFAIGGGGHRLALEYLLRSLNVPAHKVETAMYKGPAQALIDVMGGHAEFGITPVAVGYPHVKEGRLKVIGLSNEHPLPGLESVPLMKTVAPGLFIHGCWNIILPKGTPDNIVKWYRDNFVQSIRSAESAEKFRENYMFTTPTEHDSEGVRKSMTELRRIWQPIARTIQP